MRSWGTRQKRQQEKVAQKLLFTITAVYVTTAQHLMESNSSMKAAPMNEAPTRAAFLISMRTVLISYRK